MEGSGYTDIPVWDGDPKNLPALWQKFLYNGREFILFQKPGGRTYVVDTKTSRPDLAMAIRIVPGKTGEPVSDVLIKSGIITPEDLASMTEKENQDLVDLVHKFTETALRQHDAERWCEERGITTQELSVIKKQVVTAALLAELTEFMLH